VVHVETQSAETLDQDLRPDVVASTRTQDQRGAPIVVGQIRVSGLLDQQLDQIVCMLFTCVVEHSLAHVVFEVDRGAAAPLADASVAAPVVVLLPLSGRSSEPGCAEPLLCVACT